MQARRDAKARDLLLGAIERGDVCWCWPVRYELMLDARGSGGIAAVERTLEGLREIPVGAHRFPTKGWSLRTIRSRNQRWSWP